MLTVDHNPLHAVKLLPHERASQAGSDVARWAVQGADAYGGSDVDSLGAASAVHPVDEVDVVGTPHALGDAGDNDDGVPRRGLLGDNSAGRLQQGPARASSRAGGHRSAVAAELLAVVELNQLR